MDKMDTVLVFPRNLVNQVLAHAQQDEHIESCGLISASGGNPSHYYAVKNIAADPSTRFEMEPAQQIAAMKHMREQGEDLFAIVHSHPEGPPLPSATDMQEVGYPDAYYIIVSLHTRGVLEMRGFKITDGEMQPVELRYEDEI
jgi:proteasome lid subunit RPN8/RPN11